jgi:hypothetical protein
MGDKLENVQLDKDVVKEALKEWLSERMAEFGWWTLKGIGYLIFGGFMYVWFATHGWSVPK